MKKNIQVQPLITLTKLYNEFFNSEKTGGAILLFTIIMSLFLANSPWQADYFHLIQHNLAGHSAVYWINDGLMTIFFLLIGLELEREIYKGELSNIKNATLPIVAALGGMLLPAGIFTLLNFGLPSQSGAGIPMATDIAFAVGILSLLGKRVPASLKIFLTALAVIDDLGAIIVITLFYSTETSFLNLCIALAFFGILLLLNRLGINNLIPYLLGGFLMWYFMMHSGIHATITGVLLAFAVPFRDGSEKSPSFILQHYLHKPVAFFILPLFALTNTCISIGADWKIGLGYVSSLGILFGLIIGKPLGIFAFSFIGVKVGLCTLPPDVKWKNILGVGFLGGIGFTMSIFITLLAFNNSDTVTCSKFAIMVASLISGIIGYLFLRFTLKKPIKTDT